MTRADLIERYEAAIAASERVERKGKANPYTSANGHMFSQINKDYQLGIRLPKALQAELGLVEALLEEGFAFVSAMPPGGKKT